VTANPASSLGLLARQGGNWWLLRPDYYDDHAPPHFHAYYCEEGVLFSIETLEVIEGKLPKRAFAMVLEWAVEHREELRESRELAARHEPLKGTNSVERPGEGAAA
jgi:Domain of unknown function (DUF4160)